MSGEEKINGFTQLNPEGSGFRTGNLTGFTLIELLVVVLIIGILVTSGIIALKVVRVSARDAQRIANIKQIQDALEIYKNDNGAYPAGVDFVVGQPLDSPDSSNTYINKIPSNPLPNDGTCSVSEYTYTQVDGGVSYRLQFCLGAAVGSVGPHNIDAIPNDLVNLGATAAATCGNGVIEGSEACDYSNGAQECLPGSGTYPLFVGTGICAEIYAACASDCTSCVMDCGAQ